MNLEALPTELISRICSLLGPGIPGSARNQPVVHLSDFQSLRSTCRELYRKTDYDAAVRYADWLRDPIVDLEGPSLCGFLATCRNVSLRDRVHEVQLGPDDPSDYEYDQNLEDNASEQDIMMLSNSVHFPSGPNSNEAERHQQPVPDEMCQPMDVLDESQASSEVNQLMPEFFRTLNCMKNLSKLLLQADNSYDRILDALLAAKFTRKVVELNVDPHALSTAGPESRWNSPHTFANCVQGLQLRTRVVGLYENGLSLEGAHIQNFRPTTPQLTRFLSALIAIERLELLGCRESPELRLCHGCDDLFMRNFAPMRYPQLRKLRIKRFLISGGRLRAFIKHHAETLQNINLSYLTLTDGSWRSIAQGLAKLPLITTLYLEHLQQKRRSDRHERSHNHPSAEKVFVSGTANIKSFLGIFVEHFRTVERFSRSRVARRYPKYHQAILFEMPDEPATLSQVCAELEV